jgi:hypothetical protein
MVNNMRKQNRIIAIMIGVAMVIATIIMMTAAKAAERTIKPDCWEENKGGQVIRHCEVHRPQTAAVPNVGPPVQEPPPVDPPSAVAAPTYQAPPVRAWPTQACAYGPPCPVY